MKQLSPILAVLLVPIVILGFTDPGCEAGGSDGELEPFAEPAVGPAPAFSSDESRVFNNSAELQTQPAVSPLAPVAVTRQSAAVAPVPAGAAFGDEADDGVLGGGDLATLVQQTRIIVRTVDMGIVVTDVATTVDQVGSLAEEMGGWLVSSNRSDENRGFVSIRVPAERLTDAILRLRALADEVKSEITSSRDVTDEYFDTQARLTNLEATESALIKLLDRAEKVEEALKIQESLTRVQEDVERLQGRIKLLEQTSAFSLVNVSMELVKGEMSVDAGADKTTGVGEALRFRATFNPPTDIEDFFFTWDFGDGTPPIRSDRTAPTEDEGTRVTATMTHVYSDERDSPYIAEIKMSGFGEAGEVEGEDTVIVTVSLAPIIEVFVGEGLSVDAGETVQLSGSFTRPTEVRDIKYVWDFGDGSSPIEGTVQAGVTTVVAEHVYPNHRPIPYTVRLTVTAESDTGNVEASSTTSVFAREPLGWVVAGWDIENQGKDAVRSLSVVGQGLITFGIWFLIFTPVWAVVIVIAFVVRRRMTRPKSSSTDPMNEGDGGQS